MAEPLTHPLYERQHGESKQAWAAFLLYRDLGPTRSLTEVSRASHKHRTLLGRWSARWQWVARTDAWDAYVDEHRRQRYLDEAGEMAERHARLGRALQALAARELRVLDLREQAKVQAIERAVSSGSSVIPDDEPFASPHAIARLAKVGVEVERLAVGAPTTITGEVDPGDLTDGDLMRELAEELRTLPPDERRRIAESMLAD